MASKRRRYPQPNDANRETLAGYIAHIVMYEHGVTPLDLERAYHLSPEEARAALVDQHAYFGTGGKGYGAFLKHVKKAIAKKAWFEAPDPKAIPGAARAYGRYAWLLNSESPNTDQGRKDASDIDDLQRSLNNVGFNGWGLAIDNWPEALSYYNAAPSVYRPHARNNNPEEARETPMMQAHREPADEHAATELVMYIENTSDLSPDGPSGQGRSVLLNALRKWKKGTYDPKLAVKLFEYLTEAGAKRYAKEFDSEKNWSTMFNPATRHEAAKQLEASFRNAAENGEYGHVDTRFGDRTREVMARKKAKRAVDFSDEDSVLTEMSSALDIPKDELEITESQLTGFGAGTAYTVSINGGHKEWTVVENYDQMNELALAVVKQDLEEDPSMFEPNFIQQHINTDRLRNDLESDVRNNNEEMLRDMRDRDFWREADRYIDVPEKDEDGDMPDPDDYIEDVADKMTNEQLKDPMAYLEDIYGDEAAAKAIEIAGIDIDSAADEAVRVDGAAHFLARYDNNDYETPGGLVYWRDN